MEPGPDGFKSRGHSCYQGSPSRSFHRCHATATSLSSSLSLCCSVLAPVTGRSTADLRSACRCVTGGVSSSPAWSGLEIRAALATAQPHAFAKCLPSLAHRVAQWLPLIPQQVAQRRLRHRRARLRRRARGMQVQLQVQVWRLPSPLHRQPPPRMPHSSSNSHNSLPHNSAEPAVRRRP